MFIVFLQLIRKIRCLEYIRVILFKKISHLLSMKDGVWIVTMVGIAFVLLGINAIYSNGFTGWAVNQTNSQIHEIKIENFEYLPEILEIGLGDTVRWTNVDSARHTITSESNTLLNSALLAKDETYSHTFNESGEYSYFCRLHSYMKGKIVVR